MSENIAIRLILALAVIAVLIGVYSLVQSRSMITKAALSGAVVCRAIVLDGDGTLVCIPKE